MQMDLSQVGSLVFLSSMTTDVEIFSQTWRSLANECGEGSCAEHGSSVWTLLAGRRLIQRSGSNTQTNNSSKNGDNMFLFNLPFALQFIFPSLRFFSNITPS